MVESYPLYNGEVVLEFNPGNHQYHVVIKGRKYKVPSVTRALESLAKPALVPWAVNATLDFIRPAIQPGVEHAESYLEEVYARAKRESTRIKDTAADVGGDVHAALEGFINTGRPPEGLEGQVADGVRAGIDWLSGSDIQWRFTERPIYSRRHRYSGRLDGIADINGICSLIDWKTSKRVYPEYRFQTAAYVKAYEEEFPDQVIQQRVLIRLGKDDGVFEPHVFDRKSLRKDFNAFLAALKIYQRLQEITKEHKNMEKPN